MNDKGSLGNKATEKSLKTVWIESVEVTWLCQDLCLFSLLFTEEKTKMSRLP